MLRFDLPPVYSNVARVQAAITLLVMSLVAMGYGYLSLILVLMGFVRGFISSRKCPSHVIIEKALMKFNLAGKKENAGAKMFADKLLFVGSLVCALLYFSGISLYIVPAIVLCVFAAADLFFGFCAGCWAYTLYYARKNMS